MSQVRIIISALFLFLTAFTTASAACDDTNGAKGINLKQTSCISWVNDEVLAPGQYYVSLDFNFKLLNSADSSANKSWLDYLRTLAGGEQVEEIMLSVLPKLGSFSGIEVPVYRYVADKGGATFDTTGNYHFATPLIRYDQKPLGFTIRLRAGQKVKYDTKKLIDTVQPLLNATAPASWLLSEAAKPVIDAVAGIGSKILESAYNYQDSDTAEFDMVDDKTDGAVTRKLEITTAGNRPVKIGELTVKVRFKRSLVAAKEAVTEPKRPAESVLNYAETTEILNFELPSIDLARKTVMSGLSTEDDDMKALSTVLFDDDAKDIKDACGIIKTASTTRFGFNDVDKVRLLYELLKKGGHVAALVQGSTLCLDKGDWMLAKSFSIFEPEAAGGFADPQKVKNFATGLRKGMREDVEYSKQINPIVEVGDDTGLMPPGCIGDEVEKEVLLDCLNVVKANRFETERENTTLTKTSLILVTRAQIAQAISDERQERFKTSPDPANKQDKDWAFDKNFAIRASEKIKNVIRLSIWFAQDQTINRLKFERKSKEEIGGENVRRLGLSCWAPNKEGSAPCFESGIAYPQ